MYYFVIIYSAPRKKWYQYNQPPINTFMYLLSRYLDNIYYHINIMQSTYYHINIIQIIRHELIAQSIIHLLI